MSQPIDRRAFMHRAAGASAVVSMSLAGPLTRRVLGANDRVRVGVIGTGRQGISNMKAFQKHGAEIAAVCDVYAPNLAKGKAEAQGWQEAGRSPPTPTSGGSSTTRRSTSSSTPRRTTGTPCRWSWPARRGRTSSSRSRSRCRSRRARRCSPPPASTSGSSRWGSGSARTLHFQQAAQIVRQGLLGKVTFVRTWNYSNAFPDGIGNPPDSEPPAGLDWDMWLGPAPKVPFNANRFGVRRPLVHLPPLLGLLERHARRLGRPPRRHRAVGPRDARARR